jgi:hypothetical protein
MTVLELVERAGPAGPSGEIETPELPELPEPQASFQASFHRFSNVFAQFAQLRIMSSIMLRVLPLPHSQKLDRSWSVQVGHHIFWRESVTVEMEGIDYRWHRTWAELNFDKTP